jgi:hypothetical protein
MRRSHTVTCGLDAGSCPAIHSCDPAPKELDTRDVMMMAQSGSASDHNGPENTDVAGGEHLEGEPRPTGTELSSSAARSGATNSAPNQN